MIDSSARRLGHFQSINLLTSAVGFMVVYAPQAGWTSTARLHQQECHRFCYRALRCCRSPSERSTADYGIGMPSQIAASTVHYNQTRRSIWSARKQKARLDHLLGHPCIVAARVLLASRCHVACVPLLYNRIYGRTQSAILSLSQNGCASSSLRVAVGRDVCPCRFGAASGR